jgi:hypothetical protein
MSDVRISVCLTSSSGRGLPNNLQQKAQNLARIRDNQSTLMGISFSSALLLFQGESASSYATAVTATNLKVLDDITSKSLVK